MHHEPKLDDIREEVREEMMQFMNLHDIEHLVQVLLMPDEELLEMEGFGMRLMVEVQKLRRTNPGSPD